MVDRRIQKDINRTFIDIHQLFQKNVLLAKSMRPRITVYYNNNLLMQTPREILEFSNYTYENRMQEEQGLL